MEFWRLLKAYKLNVMKDSEHSFRQNAMFSAVTLESIMLKFSSLIYLTLAPIEVN